MKINYYYDNPEPFGFFDRCPKCTSFVLKRTHIPKSEHDWDLFPFFWMSSHDVYLEHIRVSCLTCGYDFDGYEETADTK